MDKIRIGIVGLGARGRNMMDTILLNGAEVVAVCDVVPEKIEKAKEKLGDVPGFTDYHAFLETPMDAVYITTYFPEHAPIAICALKKNIHVICECLSNGTMAEGVALVRAAEKSKAIYMLAENYPYMDFNREMQRVYKGGTLGKIMFAEGEYNHPVALTDDNFTRTYYDSIHHWRCHLPASYYITHSLGPLMAATHANPVRVTAMPVFIDSSKTLNKKYTGDKAAIITTLNDDDSVFRVVGCSGFGAHENSYRLACEKGQIENVRGGEGKVMLRYNDWEKPEGEPAEKYYLPEPDDFAKLAAKTGHGGGDFYMFADFFDCLRTGRKPYLDVYVATRMASVGILAHRSLMAFGKPYDIPDFSKEADRVAYENDTLTPFYIGGKAPTLPCCSRPDYQPCPEAIANLQRVIDGK